MSKIKLITVCSHPEHATTLIKSAENNGWDLVIIKCEWKGFGTKIIETYNYLKSHSEIEYFVFCDAFDVVVLDAPFNFLIKDQIIFSAEKGCWPDDSLRSEYPNSGSPFNFLNSGLYYATRERWICMVEDNPIEYLDDDQLYFTKLFLSGKYGIELDNFQDFFNSHSFINDDEYIYRDDNKMLVKIDGRNILGSPSLIHFNGRTEDPKFNELIKI